MSPVIAEPPSLRIVFGRVPIGVFDVGVPLLAGDDTNELFAAAVPTGQVGSIMLFKVGEWVLGAAAGSTEAGLDAAAQRLYRDIFQATRGLHLARIWNYVPGINEPGGPAGLENYRVFCQGRARAFEQEHGAGFKLLVPSASAVGCRSPALTVAFVACRARPRHVENPLQVSAYDYPREFGPRSPSFARATIVADSDKSTVFISGTAAIRGHATVAPDDTAGQLACTLENLREISRACGLGANLDRDGASQRHFKVYVRRAADQPLVATALTGQLFGPRDRVCYLHADICRKPLLVEIEAMLVGVPHAPRAA